MSVLVVRGASSECAVMSCGGCVPLVHAGVKY